MKVRSFALVAGVFFLFIGLAGFIPGFMTMPAGSPTVSVDVPRLWFDDGYGYVLGLFPTNFIHNAVHIVVGVLGIAASTSWSGSLVYTRGFAIAYILIALMGLLPLTNTTFGAMPIYGNNVWLNAMTGAIALYLGFFKPISEADIKASASF